MDRTSIPERVKQQLRSEAGFGCCFCGLPIIQYHHILPYSVEVHHRPEDMMIVCPTCHDKITKRAVPEFKQRQAKAKPFNLQRRKVKGLLEINQSFCAIEIGSALFVGQGPIITINKQEILGLYLNSVNALELSLHLSDESNNSILSIERNEWISGDYLPWDIKSDWQKLKIRSKARQVLINIDATRSLISLQGRLWSFSGAIKLDKQGVHIDTGSKINVGKAAFINIGINLSTGESSTNVVSLMNPMMNGRIDTRDIPVKQMQQEAIADYKIRATQCDMERNILSFHSIQQPALVAKNGGTINFGCKS